MTPVIRADQLLGFIDLMSEVYANDDGARAMAKSVRTYVTALAGDADYQRDTCQPECSHRNVPAEIAARLPA